jgi:hypothetical protein
MTNYKTVMALFLVATVAAAVSALSGCRTSAELEDNMRVQEQQTLYATAQPIPRFDYSLERAVTIELYQARNSRVATHTVWRSDTGIVEGDCPSIAYPLPYDTSLTNPLMEAYHTAIGQAEPNGLFASQNSIATWVRCVVDGEEVPVYVESKVTAYPYPVEVDYETNRVTRASGHRPSVRIEARPPE